MFWDCSTDQNWRWEERSRGAWSHGTALWARRWVAISLDALGLLEDPESRQSEAGGGLTKRLYKNISYWDSKAKVWLMDSSSVFLTSYLCPSAKTQVPSSIIKRKLPPVPSHPSFTNMLQHFELFSFLSTLFIHFNLISQVWKWGFFQVPLYKKQRISKKLRYAPWWFYSNCWRKCFFSFK